MGLQVEILDELNDSILSDIEALNEHSRIPKINTTRVFLRTFDSHLKDKWRPLFVKIIEDNLVKGIIPLMWITRYRKGLVPYKTIKFYASTFSDFHDIYAKHEDRGMVIKEFFDWLFSDKFFWQEIVLDDLLEISGIISPIERYLKRSKLNYDLFKGKYYYINLDRNWAQIKADTSKSFVWKNVRLAKNRITEAGDWEIEFNPRINAEEIISRAKPIHVERQNILGRESRFTNSNALDSYRIIISEFISRNEFNTYWLKFKGKYIGYMLGFYIDKTFYYWNTAFLEEYKAFYPGRLLQYHALEYMHQSGYKEFNFMRGQSGYKDKWTKTTRVNYRLRIYNTNNFYGKILGFIDMNFRR